EERVAKLESAPPPAADTGALETRIAALEERMSGLSAGGGATVDLTPVEGRLAALEDRLATLAQGGGKGGDSGGDIAALREDLASMQREVQGALQTLRQRAETPAPGAGQQQGAQKSGQIQAALSLREAVARGAVPQGTIRDAGALGLATAPLEEALQAGPVSLDMLTAAFNDNAGAMIQAARPPASGLMGRIAEGARSLISIRAAGPQAGDTPEAVISRIDAALQRGDSGLASAEFQKLPAESQAASGNFGELLKRREAQLGAADALVRQAIGG
ncbi:MAG: COG4223 family protein, partial [Flavobacteriaceae bacterium]